MRKFAQNLLAIVLLTAAAGKAGAQGIVTLHAFTGLNSNGNNLDGAQPQAPLAAGTDGYLYGTTATGGQYGDGTIFKVAPNGSGDVLYSFDYPGQTFFEDSGVTLGPDGNFYGTTQSGGANGYGSIYRITPGGTFTTIYSFSTVVDGTNIDGATAYAGLLYDPATGLFYGTTQSGGIYGGGTVYSVSTSGSLNVMYSFQNTDTVNSPEGDGNTPEATLTIGPDGALYGTTLGGGSYDSGTAFRITTDASSFATIYVFTGYDDGGAPNGLTLGPDQNFYGTAQSGGVDNWGTVFMMTTSGSVNTLYSFTNGADGAVPTGNVIFGPGGYLYGTSSHDGAGGNAAGTVFAMSPAGGSPIILYTFGNVWRNGAYPLATLTLGPVGKYGMTIYGTTELGGNGNGTVFGVDLEVTSKKFYQAEAGTYEGLLENDGMIKLTLSGNGAVTGKVDLNGSTHSVKGALDLVNGYVSPANAAIPLSMELYELGSTGSYEFTGLGAGQSFNAHEAIYGKRNHAPEAGSYPLQLTATSTGSGIPQTPGSATLKVTNTGSVTFKGKLPDGTAFSASSLVTTGTLGDQCVIYSPVTYKNTTARGAKGLLVGTITFPGGVVTGPLEWMKPQQKSGAFPSPIDTGLAISP